MIFAVILADWVMTLGILNGSYVCMAIMYAGWVCLLILAGCKALRLSGR